MEKDAVTEKPKIISKRIYIKCPVVTPDPIVTIQQDLGLKQNDRVPVNKLHLTLFHLGKPDELFNEVANKNPDIHPGLFAEELSRVLRGTLVEKEEIDVVGKELGLFEKNAKPVIVLRLQENDEIRELRGEFLGRFEKFLASCGITDIPSYMESSPNLRYQSQENFDPHISIGFPGVNVILPRLGVSRMGLVLGSPRLANSDF